MRPSLAAYRSVMTVLAFVLVTLSCSDSDRRSFGHTGVSTPERDSGRSVRSSADRAILAAKHAARPVPADSRRYSDPAGRGHQSCDMHTRLRGIVEQPTGFSDGGPLQPQ